MEPFFNKRELTSGMLGALSVVLFHSIFRIYSSKNKSGTYKRILKHEKDVSLANVSIDGSTDSENVVFTIFIDEDEGLDFKNINKLVNTILLNIRKEDEIAIVINSHGGSVLDFYAVYDQLNRLKTSGAKINIFIKKIAASGGYLLASIGDVIYGTENCVTGSIGVFRSGFNFSRLLENLSVVYKTYKSCEYKNVGDPFDPLTDVVSEKQQKDVENIHKRFTATIKKHRKNISEELFNGDTWYGSEAKENGLIDDLRTIDDYIMEKSKKYQIYNVSISKKSTQDLNFLSLILKLL